MPLISARQRLPRSLWWLVLVTTGLGGCVLSASQMPLWFGQSEAEFFARVREGCAAKPVGEHTVGGLLAENDTFRRMTGQLYRGELSNDLYLEQVRAAYPAPDANLPAVGCIIAQLHAGLGSRRCAVAGASSERRSACPPRQD